MAKKKDGFPKLLYVWRERNGDNSYLLLYESLDDLSDKDGEIVGVYTLDNTVKVSVKTEIRVEDTNT